MNLSKPQPPNRRRVLESFATLALTSLFAINCTRVPVTTSTTEVHTFAAASTSTPHFVRLAKGGHFAAWEQPTLFVAELRSSFEALRKSSEVIP